MGGGGGGEGSLRFDYVSVEIYVLMFRNSSLYQVFI